MLLPVFVILVMAVLYLGHLALIGTATQRAARFGLFSPGRQDEAAVTDTFFWMHDPTAYWGRGGLETWRDEARDAPWGEPEVREALQDKADATRGYYYYDLETRSIQFRLIEGESPFARYIEAHRLLEVSDEAAGILSAWADRVQAQAGFVYDPWELSARWADAGQGPDDPTTMESPLVTGLGRDRVSRGRHPGWGNSEFNRDVVRQLIGEDLPAPDQGAAGHWDPD